MDDKKSNEPGKGTENQNADWQGVDKDPQDEKGKAEPVTKDDLKEKKVDADPAAEEQKK